jgi:hypothetical protein
MGIGARSAPVPRLLKRRGDLQVGENARRRSRPVEGGSRTVYLVTPVTYDAEKADDETVAQAFDKLVQAGTADGGLEECGVSSVGLSVIQPTGDHLPMGIE